MYGFWGGGGGGVRRDKYTYGDIMWKFLKTTVLNTRDIFFLRTHVSKISRRILKTVKYQELGDEQSN